MTKRREIPKRKPVASPLDNLANRLHNAPAARYIFMGVLLVLLALWFFPIAFLGYVPQAGDTIHWKGSSELITQYNNTHTDQCLWTPNLFGGMPTTMITFPPKYPFLNELRKVIDHVFNWRILTLFLAGLGVYILLIMQGFEPLAAFLGGVAFALSCHFIGLLQIGHNTKVRAIAYIPWIFMAWQYLRRKMSLLGLGLLTVFLIGQFRENHPQIVYYTFILLGVTWIFQLIWAIQEKDGKRYALFTALVVLALVITAMAVANPYLSIREYSDYSIRDREGLDLDYAQGWSFHPLETLTFVIPGFFGVDADYWGWMPSQGVYMYMGVIILLLALVGVFWGWRRYSMVRVLAVVSIVALAVSFGKYLNFLSVLLIKYLPYFDKFRVPAMTLVLVQFSCAVLAAYGVRVILDRREEGDARFLRAVKVSLIVLAVLFVMFWMVRAYVAVNGLEQAADAARYQQYPQYLDKLKAERLDLLTRDGVRSFFLMAAFLCLTWALLARKLGKYTWMWLVVILCVTDLLVVDGRFLRKATSDNPGGLVKEKQLDSDQFTKTKVDEYLLSDPDIFRILPIAVTQRDIDRRNWQFENNRWAYYHQTIWGYHPSKLKRYNEILQNCMMQPTVHWFPFNMNVVDMLNTKYIIHPELPRAYFRGVAWHMGTLPVFENPGCLPRAWFVDSTLVLTDKQQIFDTLNSKDFNPATTAIIESPITGISAPDSTAAAVMDNAAFGPHHEAFDVTTDKQALLVMSEIYYPAGWVATIDGKTTPIVPVNYILRGVVVPAGQHRVEMTFSPTVYAFSARLSLIGLLLAALITLVGAALWVRKNFRGENVYVLKQ